MHFEFIVYINISSLSAVKSAPGMTGNSDALWDYPALYVTCYSTSLSLLHAPAFSIPMTKSVLHSSVCVCVCVCARARARVCVCVRARACVGVCARARFFFPFAQFLLSSLCVLSPSLSFFPFLLSLVQAVPFSFYSSCSSLFFPFYLSLSFVIISTP
jgi:hypothetical protein